MCCEFKKPLLSLLQSWSQSRPPLQNPICPSLSSSTAGTSGRISVSSASLRKSARSPRLGFGFSFEAGLGFSFPFFFFSVSHFTFCFQPVWKRAAAHSLFSRPSPPQVHLSRHQSLLQHFPGRRQRHGPQLLLDLPAVGVRRGRRLAVALGDGRQVRPPWHPAPLHDDDGAGLSDPSGPHGV